jgi:twinkle protein
MYLKINTSEVDVPIHKLKEGFDAVFGSNRILLLDHQGSVNDSKLLDMIEYMALMGCGYIFLDHITLAVSEGANGLTGNEAVDSVMASLLSQVKRHNPWLGVISHLRKSPAGGKSFEEGIMPSLDDIKGSGSIKQICFQIIGFARNQVSEEPLDRSTVRFSVLKNRFSGLTGPACITYYDIHTGRYQAEIPSEVFEVETPFDIDKDDNEQLAIEQIAFEACYRDYYLE